MLQVEVSADREGGIWSRIDAAAFGLIYGAISALSLLMTFGAHPEHPFKMAVALFGSIVAITLAKAFAEVTAAELSRTGDAPAMRFSDAWHHARPTLVAANVPTLLVVASGLGLVDMDAAIAAGQSFIVAMLLIVGGRVGWSARGTLRALALGAAVTGGIGFLLAAMKYVLH
jgi:hypothetical protein